MCGVSFYFSSLGSFDLQLQHSLGVTQHRGPDSSDVYSKVYPFGYVGLGHNRLSIVDTSLSGLQPMRRHEVVISFNGEIYNYKEIRLGLIERGYRFESSTDTEVILYAYIEYGVDCFKMLEGMFAFVIIDEKVEKIYIVRDVVGIKPIYVYQGETGLYACSEIKGLKCFSNVVTTVSMQDTFEFFNTGFLYEPSTGYEYIRKLLPGHYIEFEMDTGHSTTGRFANISDYSKDWPLRNTVLGAVERQKLADVPVGIFFSGGADSSLLACLAGDVDLLFAKYDKADSSDVDFKYSALIAKHLGSPLSAVEIESAGSTASEIMSTFYFVADNTEELISDYTFWSTYLLSKSARSNGFKVMLSGMGGDEGFAGYPRYLVVKFHRLIKVLGPFLKLIKFVNFVPKSLGKRFDRLLSYINEKNWAVGYSRLLGYFSREELCVLFNDFESLNTRYEFKLDGIRDSYSGPSERVKLAQHYDSTGFLAHNLAIADKASMLASIELRVPLLDERVYSAGLAEPGSSLVVGISLKKPLRRLLSSLLPKRLVDRPKTGFNPPLDGLIDSLGEPIIKDELASLAAIFDLVVLNEIVTSHFAGLENNTYKIWQLLYFSRWLKTNR